MILPEKSGQYERRCDTDVGGVMSCHLYVIFCLLMRGGNGSSWLSWADKANEKNMERGV